MLYVGEDFANNGRIMAVTGMRVYCILLLLSLLLCITRSTPPNFWREILKTAAHRPRVAYIPIGGYTYISTSGKHDFPRVTL